MLGNLLCCWTYMTFNLWYLVEAFILSALWVPGVHIFFARLTTLRQKAAKSGSISVTTLKMKLHICVVCVSLMLLCLKWISSKRSRQCFKRQDQWYPTILSYKYFLAPSQFCNQLDQVQWGGFKSFCLHIQYIECYIEMYNWDGRSESSSVSNKHK